MKKFLLVLFLILGVVAGVLFSGPGQERVLLPLVNFYLKQRVAEHRVVLTRLEPGPASLTVEGTVDRTIRFVAQGPVRWIGPNLDLRYRIAADEVLLEGKRYPLQMALQGTVEGTPSRMKIQGGGEAFGAKLRYRFSLLESKVVGSRLEANGARVEQLLALAGVAPYATGRLDLKVDLPSLEEKEEKGEIRFSVRKGTFDAAVLKRSFGVELPRVEGYRLDGSFRLADGLVRGGATLRSPLLNLKLDSFKSDRSFRIYKSRYSLEIPQLSRLKKVTKITLYGPWNMAGEFYYDRRYAKLQVRGTSPSLEGESRFFYDDGRLSLKFHQAGLPQLLALTGQTPLIASGRFDAELKLTDLKGWTGSYRLRANGVWDRVELAKLAGRDPGENLDFALESDGRLKKGILQAKAAYRNRLLNLEIPSLRYALNDGALEGGYRLEIPELARVASLHQAGIGGKVEAKGSMSYLPVKKIFKLEGQSASFGGETKFLLRGNRLSLTLKGVDPSRLLALAGQGPLLEGGTLDGELRLSDLARRTGEFRLNLGGTLDRKRFKKRWQIDPGAGVKVRLKGTGKLKGDEVLSTWHATTPLGTLAMEKCRMILSTGRCDGAYRLEIPELARLKSLTQRQYHGPLRLAGRIVWDKTLRLDGGGREWGGRLDYQLQGDLLRLKAAQMQAGALMKMLGYPSLIEGRVAADLRYNLGSQKGTLGAELTQASFVRSTLTMVASRALKYDLAKERFDRVRLSSLIDGPRVVFNLDARSKHLLVKVQKGKFDRLKGTIDAVVAIEEGGKRYRFKLSGPLARPRVIPLLTQDLVDKATQELKKHKVGRKIEKAIPKELKESGNPIGNFLKKLF